MTLEVPKKNTEDTVMARKTTVLLVPSWYMVATNDQMIPPRAEKFMAKRMGAEVRKVASSHAVMVSHPQEAAGLITLAADAVADSTPAFLSNGKQRVRLVKSGQPPMRDMEN